MSSYLDGKELFLGPKTNQYGSHMVMTNVMKELKTKFVNVDTRFRDEYNFKVTSDYNITLPERFTEVRNISVTNVEIPMTFYNISDALGNNALKLTKPSTSTTLLAVIPDGNYTQSTLVQELNSLLINPFDEITFDISNNFSTFISSTNAFNINFDVDSRGNFSKYNFKSRLGWLLGFRTQDITFSNTVSFRSPALVNLNGPRYLYLVVDEFTGSGNQKSFVSPLPTSSINKNILARITMDQTTFPFMSVIPANRHNGYLLSDMRSYTGKVDIQKLNVQLINEYGIPMNLNGADFSFCLCLEHE
jgi:hypothetical protein